MIHYLYTLILVTHIYDSFSVTHRKCVGLNINNVCSCSWTILESIFYLAENMSLGVRFCPFELRRTQNLTLCTRRKGHYYIQYPALVRPWNKNFIDELWPVHKLTISLIVQQRIRGLFPVVPHLHFGDWLWLVARKWLFWNMQDKWLKSGSKWTRMK